MNGIQFDAIAKRFSARRLSRRQVVERGGAGLAAATVAATGLRAAAAQGATPQATPDAVELERPTEFLFVQSFAQGSIEAAMAMGLTR